MIAWYWIVAGYAALSFVVGCTDKDTRDALLTLLVFPLFPFILLGALMTDKGWRMQTRDAYSMDAVLSRLNRKHYDVTVFGYGRWAVLRRSRKPQPGPAAGVERESA